MTCPGKIDEPLKGEIPALSAKSMAGNVGAQFRVKICLFPQSTAQCLVHTRPTKPWMFVAVNNIAVNRYVMVSVVSHMWKIPY